MNSSETDNSLQPRQPASQNAPPGMKMDVRQQADRHSSPPEVVQSSPKKRYTVILNAATTAIQNSGGSLISNVEQHIIYHLSILDTSPSYNVVHQYHTVVRVCLDDGQSQSSSPLPWTASENGVCTVNYSPYPQNSEGSSPPLPTLRSSSQASFSVTWRPNIVTGGSYCVIPITFTNFKSPGDMTLRLCAGTERIRVTDVNMSRGEGYQESFALIRLFSEDNAQATRVSEIGEVEQELAALDLAIAQTDVKIDEMTPRQKNMDKDLVVGSKYKQRHPQKRKASSTEAVSTKRKAEFACRISPVRPVQVFRPVSAMQGESRPFRIPLQQIKHSKASYLNSTKLEEMKVAAQSTPVCDNGTVSLEQMRFLLGEAHAYKAKTTALKDKSNSVTCFYVRPEHLPSASYRAIYLPTRSFRNLLYGISSKLQVDLNAIGNIFYYDEQKRQVFVSGMNIMFLAHEQDLIVCLVSSAEEGHSPSLLNGIGSPSTEAHMTGIGISGMEQSFVHDQMNRFERYLNFQPEEACSTSVDPRGENSDYGMSMSEMFSACLTGQTSMSPDNEVKFEEDDFQHQLLLGAHDIDHDNYGFEPMSNLPPQWLPSAPVPKPPSLSSIDKWPAPMASLAVTEEHPNEVVEEKSGSATKSFTPGYIPPVSRKYSKARSLRKRTSSTSFAFTCIDIDSDVSKSKRDRDATALERNRIAAKKCRSTRRKKEVQLQEQSRTSMLLNQELKAEIWHLEAERAEASMLLEQHDSCTVVEPLADNFN